MRQLLIALLLAGCAKRSPAWSDPSLVDEVDAVEAQAPETILLDATTSDDPTPRSRALTLLLRTAAATAPPHQHGVGPGSVYWCGVGRRRGRASRATAHVSRLRNHGAAAGDCKGTS